MSTVVETKEHETTDLYFAAYLKAISVPFLGVFPDKDGRGRRMKFRFEMTPAQLREYQQIFFSRSQKGKVVALSYADEIRSLKAMTRM